MKKQINRVVRKTLKGKIDKGQLLNLASTLSVGGIGIIHFMQSDFACELLRNIIKI